METIKVLLAVCSLVVAVESRALNQNSSDKESFTLPAVSADKLPIPPSYLNSDRKVPAAISQEAGRDHVQLSGLSFTRSPSSQHYLSNLSAWLANKKERKITSANEKKSGSLSPLAKLVRGVYWMDSLNPNQAKEQKYLSEAEKWIHEVKTVRKVTWMEKSAKCGHNYLLVFDDESRACLKQRHNYDQIQGEIFAYFLAELLDMRHHLPPTVLSRAVHNKLFEPVIQKLHESSTFDPTKPFIITKFVDNLQPVHLPDVFQPVIVEETLNRVLVSPRNDDLLKMKKEEIRQFGDLMIFDYLIGHLDRLSSVKPNWNPLAMKEPIHNLFRADGSLIFIDNESGLFHGYRLLSQYDNLLQKFVKSNCVFNKSTVTAVKRLVENRNAGQLLVKMLQADYPQLVNLLPGLGPKTSMILNKRLRYVYKHMKLCEENEFLP